MLNIIRIILSSTFIYVIARILLTCMYWVSGADKLLHFSDAVQETASLGMPAPTIVAGLTICVQLIGSVVIITGGRFTWLGAGALGVFTASAIIVAHPFWKTDSPDAALNLAIGTEHISMIGGLVLASILAHRQAYDQQV